MNDRSKPLSGNARDLSPVVLVVDDDQSMRSALENLFQSVGLDVLTFSSASELTSRGLPNAVSCLVLDVRLPGLLSGLDLQAELAKAGVRIPIILMTSHGDIPMSVSAMKAGAVDFLTKPVRREALLRAVQNALGVDAQGRAARAVLRELQNRYENLTPREREVLVHVVSGKLNKQIAFDLGTAERTIKAHRASIMEKLGVQSIAELVRVAQELGIQPIR